LAVNTLANKITQHRTFSHIDPDIVVMTLAVDWRQTSQWMDVVARSGASLFLSPDPSPLKPGIRPAMKDAIALSVQAGQGFLFDPTSLVNTPGPSNLTGKASPALLELRSIPLHPAHHRCMRKMQSTFGHHRAKCSNARLTHKC
jgi:hypothetical protein